MLLAPPPNRQTHIPQYEGLTDGSLSIADFVLIPLPQQLNLQGIPISLGKIPDLCVVGAGDLVTKVQLLDGEVRRSPE